MRFNLVLAAVIATSSIWLMLSPTQGGAAEPSFVELKTAVRDMAECTLASTELNHQGGEWPAITPPKGQFNDAKIALLQHGANRPDLSRAQRKEISASQMIGEDARSKLAQTDLKMKIWTCLTRLDQLRPMLTSYQMSDARKEQCLKAFADGQFAQLKQYQGAKLFELFAIYPNDMPLADVISRPAKVRMMFIVLQPWTQTNVSISGDRAFDVKTVTLDDYHWAYVGLQGDCPAKDD